MLQDPANRPFEPLAFASRDTVLDLGHPHNSASFVFFRQLNPLLCRLCSSRRAESRCQINPVGPCVRPALYESARFHLTPRCGTCRPVPLRTQVVRYRSATCEAAKVARHYRRNSGTNQDGRSERPRSRLHTSDETRKCSRTPALMRTCCYKR